ncbi:MAG: FAD:protein FMN transferase [Burkholderiales bacterium]|nr:FAD:protein FMN transferase [Burkholderiales bacterium]
MNRTEDLPVGLTRRRIAMAIPLLGCAVWGSAVRASTARAHPLVQRDSRALMGTQVDIVVESGDISALLPALEQAWSEMTRLSKMMSRYDADSTVSAINQAAGVHAVSITPELLGVLKAARNISTQSEGAFDITVGTLKGWRFDGNQTTVPAAEVIEYQRRLVNYRELRLDERVGTAYLNKRDMALDLGGVAKLPILEAGMGVLKRHGIVNAMINGGGDVLVAGRLQGRPWRVGLRDPRAPQQLIGVLALEGQALVASSGDYERFFMYRGERQHHILDPATGRPTHGPHGVSLLARDAASVNGLGAAMMVLGANAGRALINSRPGVEALIVDRDQSVWRSQGMAAALT